MFRLQGRFPVLPALQSRMDQGENLLAPQKAGERQVVRGRQYHTREYHTPKNHDQNVTKPNPDHGEFIQVVGIISVPLL